MSTIDSETASPRNGARFLLPPVLDSAVPHTGFVSSTCSRLHWQRLQIIAGPMLDDPSFFACSGHRCVYTGAGSGLAFFLPQCKLLWLSRGIEPQAANTWDIVEGLDGLTSALGTLSVAARTGSLEDDLCIVFYDLVIHKTPSETSIARDYGHCSITRLKG